MFNPNGVFELNTFFIYYCFYAVIQSILLCSVMINDIGVMKDLRFYKRCLAIIPSIIIVAALAPLYTLHALLLVYRYFRRKPNAKINT